MEAHDPVRQELPPLLGTNVDLCSEDDVTRPFCIEMHMPEIHAF